MQASYCPALNTKLDTLPHSQQEKVNSSKIPFKGSKVKALPLTPLLFYVRKLKTKVPVHPENSYLDVEFKTLLCALDNVYALVWMCFMISSMQNKLTRTDDLLSSSVLPPKWTKPKELH